MFTIEVRFGAACDSSHHGEGRTLLGTLKATTDDDGKADFAKTFTKLVPTGDAVTALATGTRDTSEFSRCRTMA